MFKQLLTASAFVFSFPAMATNILAEHITLRGMDKVTGRTETMTVRTGEVISFGRLKIIPEKCFTHPPEETPEDTAFLTISEEQPDKTIQPVFSGWMFSSNPALSAMEHPVYDIWVISCSSNIINQQKQEILKQLKEQTQQEEQLNTPATKEMDSNTSLTDDTENNKVLSVPAENTLGNNNRSIEEKMENDTSLTVEPVEIETLED